MNKVTGTSARGLCRAGLRKVPVTWSNFCSSFSTKDVVSDRRKGGLFVARRIHHPSDVKNSGCGYTENATSLMRLRN
jgi:hypothetical protein